MSTHTPGPWRVGSPNASRVRWSDRATAVVLGIAAAASLFFWWSN